MSRPAVPGSGIQGRASGEDRGGAGGGSGGKGPPVPLSSLGVSGREHRAPEDRYGLHAQNSLGGRERGREGAAGWGGS